MGSGHPGNRRGVHLFQLALQFEEERGLVGLELRPFVFIVRERRKDGRSRGPRCGVHCRGRIPRCRGRGGWRGCEDVSRPNAECECGGFSPWTFSCQGGDDLLEKLRSPSTPLSRSGLLGDRGEWGRCVPCSLSSMPTILGLVPPGFVCRTKMGRRRASKHVNVPYQRSAGEERR